MLRWLVVVMLLLFGAGCDVTVDISEPAGAVAETEPEADASPVHVRANAPPVHRRASVFVVRVLDARTDPDLLFRPPRG